MTVRGALALLGRPATVAEVAALAQCSRCAAFAVLARLTEAGEVVTTGTGKAALYSLAEVVP